MPYGTEANSLREPCGVIFVIVQGRGCMSLDSLRSQVARTVEGQPSPAIHSCGEGADATISGNSRYVVAADAGAAPAVHIHNRLGRCQ